jgi:hypothetical protein
VENQHSHKDLHHKNKEKTHNRDDDLLKEVLEIIGSEESTIDIARAISLLTKTLSISNQQINRLNAAVFPDFSAEDNPSEKLIPECRWVLVPKRPAPTYLIDTPAK